MTITTMEELEAVPVDGEVEVRGGGVWTRVETGLRDRHGTVLGLDHFRGAVAENILTSQTTGPVEPGTVFCHPGYRDVTRYMWVVLRVRDDGTWDVASLLRGRFRALDHWPEDFAASRHYATMPTDRQPDYVGIVQQMGLLLLEAQEAAAKVPAVLLRDLHALAAEYGDEDDDNTLDLLLTRHGVGRELPHTMNVTISGTVSTAEIRDRLLGSDDITVYEAPSWSRVVRVTRQGPGCVCDTVTRDELAMHIPSGSNADWTFTVSH